MCPDPFAVAMTLGQAGLGLAQSAASERYAKKDAARRSAEIRDRTIAEYDRVQAEQEEQRRRAAREVEEKRRESLAARARTVVAAGEAGVTGRSVDAGLRDLRGRLARYEADVGADSLAADRAARRELEAVQRGASAELGRIQPPPTPDYWGVGLETASRLEPFLNPLRSRS